MPDHNPLPLVLRRFLLASALFTFVCGGTEVFCKLVLHLHFPYTFPIVDPGAITQDLLLHVGTFHHLHQQNFFNQAGFFYPASAAVPYALFLLSPAHARLTYYSFCAVVLLVLAIIFGRALNRRGLSYRTSAGFLITSVLLSYPFWFLLKQGNIEIVLFVLLAAGVWAFLRGHGWGAAAAFGIAGSMKLYPFIFLGLPLARRQIARRQTARRQTARRQTARRQVAQIAFGLLVAAAFTVFSLWLEAPSIPYSWRRTNEGIASFHLGYVVGIRPEQAFDHSLWGFARAFLPTHLSLHTMSASSDLYLLVVGVIGLFLYFWRIQHLPATNQVLCLTVAAICFMPVSFDYTLIHLYIPWTLLVLLAVDAASELRYVPGLAPAFLCFTVLCSPQTELIYHAATLEGRVKTVALVALLIVGLRFPFRFGPNSRPSSFSAGTPGDAPSQKMESPLASE